MKGNFYNTKRWKLARKKKLATNPLCEDCESLGLVELAIHVDHVIAIDAGGDKYGQDNLRSLCVSCHSRKTVYKDGGFGRAKSEYTPKAKGCDSNGMPIDPNHPWNNGGGLES